MVTGVETAGLVLAAIPLIICALDNYENAIGPTKAFFSWKGELSRANDELYVLLAAYDQTLRVLLSPVTSKEDLVTMIENIKSDLWSQGDIAEDLRHYLGTTYGAVMMEIEHTANGLLEILQHLTIAGSHQSSQQNLQSIVHANPPKSPFLNPCQRFFLRERVKFTMKRKTLRARMSNIRTSIEMLGRFAEGAEKLEDAPSRRRSKIKFSAPLDSIRENAIKIHRVLLSRWCTSHTRHRAGLLLEERMIRRSNGSRLVGKSTEPSGTADRFLLDLGEHLSTTKWLPTEFRIVEVAERTTTKIAVKISPPIPLDDDAPYSNPSKLVEVVEICSYLQHRTDPVVRFCLDESHKLRAYRGLPGQILQIPLEMSLTQVLPQLPRRLANGDMHRLAIILTASALQLLQTPWLDELWSKNAIIFSRMDPNIAEKADIKYPLLVTDFARDAPTPLKTNTPPAMREQKVLLALGIMLLEINSGQSIESIRVAEDLGTNPTSNTDSDLITSRRWLSDQLGQGSLSYRFASAVTSCLQAYLNPRADASDPEFCRHIEETVIKPLEEEMQCLMHGLNC